MAQSPWSLAGCFAREKTSGVTLRASVVSASAAKWWGKESWVVQAAQGMPDAQLAPGLVPWWAPMGRWAAGILRSPCPGLAE